MFIVLVCVIIALVIVGLILWLVMPSSKGAVKE